MGVVLGGAEVMDCDVIPFLLEYPDPREHGLVCLDIGFGQLLAQFVVEDVAHTCILISGLGCLSGFAFEPWREIFLLLSTFAWSWHRFNLLMIVGL